MSSCCNDRLRTVADHLWHNAENMTAELRGDNESNRVSLWKCILHKSNTKWSCAKRRASVSVARSMLSRKNLNLWLLSRRWHLQRMRRRPASCLFPVDVDAILWSFNWKRLPVSVVEGKRQFTSLLLPPVIALPTHFCVLRQMQKIPAG